MPQRYTPLRCAMSNYQTCFACFAILTVPVSQQLVPVAALISPFIAYAGPTIVDVWSLALIENASDRLLFHGKVSWPGRFRSRLATNRELRNFGQHYAVGQELSPSTRLLSSRRGILFRAANSHGLRESNQLIESSTPTVAKSHILMSLAESRIGMHH